MGLVDSYRIPLGRQDSTSSDDDDSSSWKKTLSKRCNSVWTALKRHWKAITIVALLTLGTMLGIIAGAGKFPGQIPQNTFNTTDILTTSGSSSSSAAEASPTPFSATPTTTTSATPFPTNGLPAPCLNTSSFVTGASWVGIVGMAGGWNVTYEQTASAPACCAACHSLAAGCDGWAYLQGSLTPCTLLSVKGRNPDKACPGGYVQGITIQTGSIMTAGVGPCGGRVVLI